MTRARPALVLAVLLALPGGHGRALTQEPSRVFPAGVEQVTVDVVVVDKRGEPVTGLAREDFTVLDEGRPMAILTFDRVGQPAATPGTEAAAPAARPRVATNLEAPAEKGRLFVVVFDDVHLSPGNAQAAKAAIASFIDRGAQAGDRVLLVATGGAAWWSARLPEGRADLLLALKRLDGRRILDNARERLTDYEAVQIALYRDAGVAARVRERFERYGGSSLQAMRSSQQQQQQQQQAQGFIDSYVEQRASEAYLGLRSRMSVTLGVLERCFESLERSRERKSVLLVSEGFAYDHSLDARKRAVEAARRANAALYFIDTRGLTTLTSLYSAEFGEPFAEQDLMAAVADVSREGDGAEALASDTGGFSVRETNDFAAGAVRIGRESRSHYLIGYDPGSIPQDGRFRKIEVRLRRKGLVVRARRGYYAPGGAEAAPTAERRNDPDLQRALDAPGAVADIPLRLSAFVQEEAGLGRARVVLAAEADIAKLAPTETPAGLRTTLDTLVVAAHREDAEFTRSDQQAELERRPSPPGTPVWYAFTRELELMAGAHQVKLIVRDVASRKLGSVMLGVEVPPLGELRVSTPILASALSSTRDGGLVPQLRVRRDFPPGGSLYCSFEVFGAAKGPDGLPRVTAGHALRLQGGATLGSTPPNPIRPTSIGALSRLIQIPLAGRAAGDYELVLTVTDEIAGRTREVVEPFSIVDEVRAAGR
jgi:VWFA-related protein